MSPRNGPFVKLDLGAVRRAGLQPRRSASVLPHAKPLRAEPGGELRLHPRGDLERQAREPFDEIEPQPDPVHPNELARLFACTVPVESLLWAKACQADVEAAAGGAARITIAERLG